LVVFQIYYYNFDDFGSVSSAFVEDPGQVYDPTYGSVKALGKTMTAGVVNGEHVYMVVIMTHLCGYNHETYTSWDGYDIESCSLVGMPDDSTDGLFVIKTDYHNWGGTSYSIVQNKDFGEFYQY
jgi:hypothetical protein